MYRLFTIILLLFVFSCNNSKNIEKNNDKNNKNEMIKGKIVKTMDTSKYTYIQVKDKDALYWVAGPKTKVKLDQEVYLSKKMKLDNFKSNTLNRTFKEIYFVDSFNIENSSNKEKDEECPYLAKQKKNNMKVKKVDVNSYSKCPYSDKLTNKKADFDISNIKKLKKRSDEYKVSDLYKNKKDIKNKEIEIRGIVVKFFPEILDTNWIHIQDGTDYNGKNDITVTSKKVVSVGDEITVKGVVTIDKNLGSGYFFPIIIENAKIDIK